MARRVAHIVIVDERGVRTAAVSGTLDVFTSGVLTPRVLAGLPRDSAELVVDLSELDFVDSAGVSALVRLHEHARSRALVVRAHLGADSRLNPTVCSVLRRVLPMADDDQDSAVSTAVPVSAER